MMNGFKLYGKEHLLWLLITLLCIAALFFVNNRTGIGSSADGVPHSGRADAKTPLHLLRALAVCSLLFHLLESGFRICEGSYGIDTLPLHICSISSYLVFIHMLLSWRSAREVSASPAGIAGEASASSGSAGRHAPLTPQTIIGEILFCPGIAGSLCALLAPDWTAYPAFSFISTVSFLSHIAIILYVIRAVRVRLITPAAGRAYIPVLYLAAYALVMIPLDRHFHVNYGFLNYPSPGSVLEPLSDIFGSGAGYYLGYSLLVLTGIAASYLLYRSAAAKAHKNA